jgi:hypothetical protein
MDDDVCAFVERTQVDGRRHRGVADREAAVGTDRFPVGHSEDRVRGRLDPHDVRLLGRRAGLVELEESHAPPLEAAKEHARPEVGAFSKRDRRSGQREGEQDRRFRAHAGGVEERVARLELSEPGLGGGAGRVAVARVVEIARFAALVVRPDRRAVGGGHRVV